MQIKFSFSTSGYFQFLLLFCCMDKMLQFSLALFNLTLVIELFLFKDKVNIPLICVTFVSLCIEHLLNASNILFPYSLQRLCFFWIWPFLATISCSSHWFFISRKNSHPQPNHQITERMNTRNTRLKEWKKKNNNNNNKESNRAKLIETNVLISVSYVFLTFPFPFFSSFFIWYLVGWCSFTIHWHI